MNKEVKITIAALSFISCVTGTQIIKMEAEHIDNSVNNAPLVMNLASEFNPEYIDTVKIQSMTFSIDCKTELEDYKAYLTQGILNYYSDGESMNRSFSDLVSVDNPEFKSIQNQESVCTEITIGTTDKPLNMDIDKDITLYWTWITPSKLSMYELSVVTTDGMCYVICSDDYYTVEQTVEMESEKIIESSDTKHFPFGDNQNFVITSVYSEDRTGINHLAWDIVPVNDVEIVYAVESGTVDYAAYENDYDHSQGFGQYVRIENSTSDKWFYYGHLDEILVEPGQYVEAGTPIGIYGDTGYSFGRHLHLEIRDSGEYGNKLSPAEYYGLPDEYGEVRVVPDNTDLAVKCLSLNKYFEVGNLGSNGINPNDSGAVSLGLCQWRGSNAKRMLQYLYNNNPETFSNIANKYNTYYVSMLWESDSWWEKHSITTNGNEYKFYEELLDDDSMIDLQYEYGILYENSIIADAQKHGITDEKSILLFSRAYNYLPFGGTAQAMREGIYDYPEACSCAKNDPSILKADELISLIDTGNINMVSVDTLKEER